MKESITFTSTNGYEVKIELPDNLGLSRLEVGSGEDASVVNVSAESLSALTDFFNAHSGVTEETKDWFISLDTELYEILTDAEELISDPLIAIKPWKLFKFVNELANYKEFIDAGFLEDFEKHKNTLKQAVLST